MILAKSENMAPVMESIDELVRQGHQGLGQQYDQLTNSDIVHSMSKTKGKNFTSALELLLEPIVYALYAEFPELGTHLRSLISPLL